ncbi:MAG: hypothetical protein LBN23_04760 [Paludibacter sp.]|jgi:hypothetical protein|nr:hypothetical protein [Paludibacter sp.]
MSTGFTLTGQDLKIISEKMEDAEVVDNENYEHFLYSFSDDDIVDVIANPDDWTETEIVLANNIAQRRRIELNADKIRTARANYQLEKAKELKEEAQDIYKTLEKSSVAGWFFVIALVSVANSAVKLAGLTFWFPMGLCSTFLLDYQTFLWSGEPISGAYISIIFGALFFVVYYFIKKKIFSAYVVGAVIYGIDTFLCLILSYWIGFIFHAFALTFILYYWLKKYLKNDSYND